MERVSKRYYLYNYLFILCLAILILNDHFWKWQYHNWLTGKLSDFAGLLILPLFLAFIFPKRAKYMAVLSGLFFIFWKSPFSENAIQFYNQFAPISITRVVDYTDLIALSILPFAHWLILHIDKLDRLKITQIRWHPALLFLSTCLAFMATSRSPSYFYQYNTGNVRLEDYYLVELSEMEVLETFTNKGIVVKKDSALYQKNSYLETKLDGHFPFYKIDQLVLNRDTIRSIQFSIRIINEQESEIFLNGMQIEKKLSNRQVKRKLRKYYWELFKAYDIE